MNKCLLVGFLLLSACQSATPQSTSLPEVTGTKIAPTRVPATHTLTLTPTPSATPLPPERYFTEEFDKELTHWSIIYNYEDSERVDILTENNALTFELYRSNAWLYDIYQAFEYESVHLETQVESQTNVVNAMGLVCHYDEQDGWYEFNIFSDGTYTVLFGQWLAKGIAHYVPILVDASDRIKPGIAINHMGLDCYENIIQLYINNKLIRKLNVAHIGLTSGKVGLSIASFDELPVILSFDWVKIDNNDHP